MSDSHCLVIGAGHAGAQFVQSLRQEGFSGAITLVGEETIAPYQRPPLSKAALSQALDGQELLIRNEAFYQERDIRLLLNTRIEAIDLDRQVARAGNTDIGFTHLVFATGARARRWPGEGAHLKGVHYLRDFNDATHLKAQLGTAKKAVIIGAGYVGLEVAASLRKLGLEVTVLEGEERVLKRVTGPEMSGFWHDLHTAQGVKVYTQCKVSALRGESQVSAVVTNHGEFAADLVVIGIGVEPNLELAQAAGIECANGIVVNAQMQTSRAQVYAIGDVAFHHNRFAEQWIRLESVQNAADQARVAAASICGKTVSYDALPWFWSDQYHCKLQIAGLSQGYEQALVRGDMQAASFAVLYLKQGRLTAIDAVNAPKDFMLGKRLITDGAVLDCNKAVDSNLALNQCQGV